MTSRHSASHKAFALAVAVFTVLSTTPVSAAGLAGAAPVAIGSVVGGDSVELRGQRLRREGTLFSGDTVRSSAGAANLKLSDRHFVVLQPNTQIVVNDGVEAPQIVMARGTVFFEASGVSPLRLGLEPYELTISDAGFGVVTAPGSELIGVSTSKGTIRVENTLTKEVFSVYPGLDRVFGRTISDISLGEVASAGPLPLPAAGPPPAPPQVQQQTSGMSGAAWAAIVAAVGGGAGLAAFFAGSSGKVDESRLNSANSSLATANAQAAAAAAAEAAANAAAAASAAAAAAATAQVAGLNSTITTLNDNVTTIQTAFDNLAVSEADSRNQLAGAQAALGLRINVLENHLSATQAKLSAERLKNAVLTSTAATAVAEAAAIQVIIDEIATLEVEAAVVETAITDVQSQIATQDPSLLTVGDALVLKTHAVNSETGRSFAHPEGAGPITLGLYRELDTLIGRSTSLATALDGQLDSLDDTLAAIQTNPGFADIAAEIAAIETALILVEVGLPELVIIFVEPDCVLSASPFTTGPCPA